MQRWQSKERRTLWMGRTVRREEIKKRVTVSRAGRKGGTTWAHSLIHSLEIYQDAGKK